MFPNENKILCWNGDGQCSMILLVLVFAALAPVFVRKSTEPLPSRDNMPALNLDGISPPKNAIYTDGMIPVNYDVPGKFLFYLTQILRSKSWHFIS